MRILVACEFSGKVRDAFIRKGHKAWSCDLLPGEGDYSNFHYQEDVLQIINDYPTRYSEIRALMNDLQAECGKENWDGEGANKIDENSYAFAMHFLLLNLPEEIPLPEIFCESIGRVNVEWLGKNYSVALGFNADRTILFGGYNKRIKEDFMKTSDAKEVVKKIKEIMYQ